jgi:hypothetical protein
LLSRRQGTRRAFLPALAVFSREEGLEWFVVLDKAQVADPCQPENAMTYRISEISHPGPRCGRGFSGQGLRIVKTALAAFGICFCLAGAQTFLGPVPQPQTGSVIFLHPDGAGVAHWSAARLAMVGPDGMTNWDRLPFMAVYRGHMKTSAAATSHGGATSHAFGVKVHEDSL